MSSNVRKPPSSNYRLPTMIQPYSSLETRRYPGHRSNITAVAWNKDGTRLLSAGDSSGVLIYDTSNLDSNKQSTLKNSSQTHHYHQHQQSSQNRPIQECRGHSGKISALLPSPTSPFMLATAAFDQYLNVFDTRVGTRPVHTFKLPSACLYADWAPDGNTIGIGLASDTISFIDCLSWALRPEKSKIFQSGDVNQFRWTPDCKRILFGRYNGYADVYEWPSLNHLISFRGHVSNSLTVACDPKSRYYAIASVDTTVSIWDSTNITNLFTIDRRDVSLRYLAYSSDGKVLAIAGDFEAIDLVDSDDGSHIHSISLSTWASSIAWHPTRSLLAYSPLKGARDRYSTSDTGLAVGVWGFPTQ